MDETEINECFRLLKVRRGADLAAVKRAYRRNLYRCHPDRFQNRPDLLPVAEQKTKRLVQVYGVLEQWYETHGGIDPVSPSWESERGSSPADPVPDSPREKDRVAPWSRHWTTAAAGAVAICLALSAWKYLSRSEGPFTPNVSQALGKGPASPTKVALARPAAPPPENPGNLQATVGVRAEELSAASDAREKAKRDWIQAYMKAGDLELVASRVEWGAAQALYTRDAVNAAPEIEHAQRETDRLLGRAKLESAASRAAFAKAALEQEEGLKSAYDQWLLGQGNEAVLLVREMREKDHATIGALSDTEDPRRIFEFWTADEAGGPEINIAAKTGVTVLQPDDRFFPHFRSNINLYPEGKRLVQMMESIIERHQELHRELADQELASKAEVEHWEQMHPVKAHVEGALAAVLDRRNLAEDRRGRARARLERATRAVSLQRADDAFEHSTEGREWAARVMKARANLSEASKEVAAADSVGATR